MKIQIQNPNTSKTSSPPEMMKAACTGDVLMVLPDDMNIAAAARAMKQAGFSSAVSSDFRSGKTRIPDLGEDLDAVIYSSLGICLIRGPAAGTAMAAMNKRSGQNGILIEPERYVRAFGIPDYLAGYRDGVADATARLADRVGALPSPADAETPAASEESQWTWGLQTIGVPGASWTGAGVRLAVLDTGFATQHPDFKGRSVTTKVFTGEDSIEDVQGHGTHCIGIAAGSKAPAQGPRYGVACEAEIFAGKVLDDSGSGTDGDIIKGIEWAVMNKCAVISMSLGAAVYGPGHSRAFETLARRALKAGTLIVAAAGNESYRPDQIAPVAHPANCPSILAVAAVDPALQVAFFSCGGVYGEGGQVDIAAPGVDVYSSWPEARGGLYHRMPGTSMAAPHVAGVAALLAQSDATLRGRALWDALTGRAQALPLPESDVGVGLVRVS